MLYALIGQLTASIERAPAAMLLHEIAVSSGAGMTPNENAAEAIHEALRSEPEWILFLEDDVEVIDDIYGSLWRWTERHYTDEVLFYPLGCFYPDLVREAEPAGALRLDLSLYYGSQAILMRSEEAWDFIDWLPGAPPIVAESGWIYPHERCLDLHLAAWQRARDGAPYTIVPAPCFIDHLGERSLIDREERGETGRILAYAGRGYRYGS